MIPRLWYITDGPRGTGGRPLLQVIAEAVQGGLEAVVLRRLPGPDREIAELVRALAPLRERGLRVLVSRRADVALALDLDGVHLAADALPIDGARAWLSEAALPAHQRTAARHLIGFSAHSAEEACEAARLGADYVTLSPIFPTDSKPGAPGRGLDWLRAAVAAVPVPVIALGGVTPRRTHGILAAGAWGVAAVSALGDAADVAAAARAFRSALTAPAASSSASPHRAARAADHDVSRADESGAARGAPGTAPRAQAPNDGDEPGLDEA